MKCGYTCRHNISKLNSGLSVKLLELLLQGSGKALVDNLEGACSIFLQKGSFWYAALIGFSGCCMVVA